MDTRSNEPAMVFGPFELRRAEKLLLENGQPVRLGSRALDLLCALIERAGEIVSREELVASVWPRTIVEETSLRVHISALRKALGDGQDGARYITNAPGRGYGFVAAITLKIVAPPAVSVEAVSHTRHNLPPRLTRAIGRADVIATLARQLPQKRLVSIVGAGGMGKTTVALAVAEQSLEAYPDGVHFVDLAPLENSSQVPAALGAALGITVVDSGSWHGLSANLRHSRMLLVLDNCEHVIDVAAALTERLLRGCPSINILTTSREALDAEGEWVHRLAALETPGNEEALDSISATAYPAVELFVERAMANTDNFSLSDKSLAIVRQLCTQLDGMPLAIELAAGRVDTFGLQGLAARLDDLFRILMNGRRTALPRHRTLQALFEWSHDLLLEDERKVLRRLSVFRAGFTLESAACVVAGADMDPAGVIDCVMSLSAKSLVTADMSTDAPQHRLLYTTRQFAMQKLVESGELNAMSRRHALHIRDIARSCAGDFNVSPTPVGVAGFRRIIDDIRAAFTWSMSEDGDEAIGIAITNDTLELRFCVGLVDEFRTHVDQALERVVRLDPPQPDLELRLSTAWCYLSGQSPTGGGRQMAMFERIWSLCEVTGEHRDHVNAFHSLLVGSFGQGQYNEVRRVVDRLRPLCSGRWEPMAIIVCDRFLLMAQHFQGDQLAAKRLIDKVANYETRFEDRWYVGQVPRAVSMRIIRSRIHWIEGEPDRAMQVAMEAVGFAVDGHPFALAQALGMAAIPIAIWRGDNIQARQLAIRLMEHARPFALTYWKSFSDSFLRVLDLRERHVSFDDDSYAASAWRLPMNPMELDLIATMSEDLVTVEAVARVASGQVGWCAPEVMRANASARLAVGTISVTEAQASFERALQLAREQGALAWEVRIVASLARLWRQEGRTYEAVPLLSKVLARFNEGLATTDLVAARTLLAELSPEDNHVRRKHA